jgi:hypothetical protein
VPAEDRFEFGDGCAVLGRMGGRDLTDPSAVTYASDAGVGGETPMITTPLFEAGVTAFKPGKLASAPQSLNMLDWIP